MEPGDASAVWAAWWSALLRLARAEGLVARSAGVRSDSTPQDTHAVVRCAPLTVRAPTFAVVEPRDVAGAEVAATSSGWRGHIVLAR